MKLTDEQTVFLDWLNGCPRISALVYGRRKKVAESLIFHDPSVIEAYEWMDGGLIVRLLEPGRLALEQNEKEG